MPIPVSVAVRRPAALVLTVALAVLPGIALLVDGAHHVQIDAWIHFVGVGFAAAIAMGAALALTVLGALQSDGRAVLAGLAFSMMAALLCLHGASTPGILVGSNGVVAFTGGATLPVGCAILALGTLSALRGPEAVRPLLVALVLGACAILALGISMIHWPGLVPSVPAPRSPLALAVLAVGLAATALLVVRALRTYLLTRRVLDLAVVVGIAWLGTALVASLVYSSRTSAGGSATASRSSAWRSSGSRSRSTFAGAQAISRGRSSATSAPSTSSPRRRRSSARTSVRCSSRSR